MLLAHPILSTSLPLPHPRVLPGVPSTILHSVHFVREVQGYHLPLLCRYWRKMPIPLGQCNPAPQHTASQAKVQAPFIPLLNLVRSLRQLTNCTVVHSGPGEV